MGPNLNLYFYFITGEIFLTYMRIERAEKKIASEGEIERERESEREKKLEHVRLRTEFHASSQVCERARYFNRR